MEQVHTIGKLELSHYLPTGEYAPAVRETTTRICYEQLLPALNEVLNSWTDPAETFRIDRIEICLHAKSVRHLEQMMVDEILKKMKELYDPVSGVAERYLSVEKIPRAKSNFESWIYFLRHGSLIHTTNVPEQKTWEQDILEVLATELSAKEACRGILMNYPQAITRMILQFEKDFIQSWAAAYSGVAAKLLTTLVQNWETIFERQDFRELVYNRSWSLSFIQKQSRTWLIYKIIKQAERQDPDLLLEDLAGCCFNKKDIPDYFFALEKFLAAREDEWPVLAVAVLAWRRKNPLHFQEPGILQKKKDAGQEVKTQEGSLKEEEIDALKPGEFLSNDDDSTGTVKQDSAIDTTKKIENYFEDKAADINIKADDSAIRSTDVSLSITENEDSKFDEIKTGREVNGDHQYGDTINESPDREEEYDDPGPSLHYINNAGLVLLYPYLQSLFESQGLLLENEFKNSFSRDKAVQFVCYLAHGETGLPEYELVLPKLLCGYLPVDTINRFVQLSDEEKAEADSLLRAVIVHWKTLGNTSPDGLRANFLQREGRLQWKSNEWRLRVTQHTHDILLERLPWGISIIRLRWMKHFLKTEWI